MSAEGTFWLPANAPASVLERHLDTEGTALVTLHLTNCLVADPDELSRLATRCSHLRTIEAVASRMKAPDLLSLMLGPAELLSHLEFSIVSGEDEAGEELEEVRKLGSGDLGDAMARNLRRLYVEVAGEANFEILEAFLERCPNVASIHVHLVDGDLDIAISRCEGILARRPLIETFSFTSEVPPPEPLEPSGSLNFRSCAAVCANVLYRRQPQSWNIARLNDLAAFAEPVHLLEPQLVLAVYDPVLDDKILQGAILNQWRDVRNLCLVLVPPADEDLVSEATAFSACTGPLMELFLRFRSLTELNLNSFHFDPNLDLTELLEPLNDLHALSLPPCGLRNPEALATLAETCPKIEDLDIRSGLNGRSGYCSFCMLGLDLNADGMSASTVSRSDGRLTINVARLHSLTFAACCNLAELRIFDHSPTPLEDYKRLGEMLSQNKRLRVLVLMYKGLNFATHAFKEDIEKAETLRILCLLSEAILIHVAEPIIRWLASSLPRLEAIHAHYKDFQNVQQQVTWMCPIEDPEELHGNIPAAEEQQPHPHHRGNAVHGRPCIFCSTQTFIGLTKPHNRGRKTNI